MSSKIKVDNITDQGGNELLKDVVRLPQLDLE